MPPVTIQLEPVSESTSNPITGVAERPDESRIPGSLITSFRVTLRDEATGQVINNRNAVELVGNPAFTIDEDGNFTWETTPADNPIIDGARRIERHQAFFEFVWQGKTGRTLFIFSVENYEFVT